MLTSTIHPTNIPLLSAYCMLLNAAITQKHQGDARISLGSVLFFKSTDINQAFGFCAESEEVGGKSQLHKGKAAGAGKKGVFLMDIDFEFHKTKNSRDLLHNIMHQ